MILCNKRVGREVILGDNFSSYKSKTKLNIKRVLEEERHSESFITKNKKDS
jgi:hypothetical protein